MEGAATIQTFVYILQFYIQLGLQSAELMDVECRTPVALLRELRILNT